MERKLLIPLLILGLFLVGGIPYYLSDQGDCKDYNREGKKLTVCSEELIDQWEDDEGCMPYFNYPPTTTTPKKLEEGGKLIIKKACS